jgi:predicted TIM-barrel enzyme
VLVGSGVTSRNLRDYDAADALIVGSDVKGNGIWSGPLDEARVRALVHAFTAR